MGSRAKSEFWYFRRRLHAHYLPLRQHRLSHLNNPPCIVDVSVKKPLIKVHISASTGGADSLTSKCTSETQQSIFFQQEAGVQAHASINGKSQMKAHLSHGAPKQ